MTLGWRPWTSPSSPRRSPRSSPLVLGALSSRTTGIYFLMLTLTYAVIGYYFFGQVTTFSGFGGITGIDPPAFLDGPVRLYYAGARSLGARLRRIPS